MLIGKYQRKNEGSSVVVGIVEKSKSFDFSIMLVFWSLASLVRNSVVLAVYLLFLVACFFTVHERLLFAVPIRHLYCLTISLAVKPDCITLTDSIA